MFGLAHPNVAQQKRTRSGKYALVKQRVADGEELKARLGELSQVELAKRVESGKVPHFGYTEVAQRRVGGRGRGFPPTT